MAQQQLSFDARVTPINAVFESPDIWGHIAAHAPTSADFMAMTAINRASWVARKDPAVIARFYLKSQQCFSSLEAADSPHSRAAFKAVFGAKKLAMYSAKTRAVVERVMGRSLRALTAIIKSRLPDALVDAVASKLVARLRKVRQHLYPKVPKKVYAQFLALTESCFVRGVKEAFLKACSRGRTCVVRTLLDADGNNARLLERYSAAASTGVDGWCRQWWVSETLLVQAVKAGYRELVALLLERGAKVDEALPVDQDAFGILKHEYPYRALDSADANTTPSALVWAAHMGDAETMQVLLDSGARAQLTPALRIAVLKKQGVAAAMVRLLLAHGAADIGAILYGNALKLAAYDGEDAEAFRLLLDAHAAPPRPVYTLKQKADALEIIIFQAAKSRVPRVAFIEALLDRGVPVDGDDGVITTPLMEAVLYGAKDIVRMLLQTRGASATRIGPKGAPIHYLAALNADHVPLAKAYDIARMLVNAGATVDAESMRIAATNTPTAVNALLSVGGAAHVNCQRDLDHATPLMLTKNDKIVAALLDGGADPRLVDKDGRSALMRAAGGTSIGLVRAHVAAAVSRGIVKEMFEHRDGGGKTVCMIAASEFTGPGEVVRVLLDAYPAGALHVHAATGRNLLMLSAAAGKVAILKAFLLRDPRPQWDLNAVDASGQTVHDIARGSKVHKHKDAMKMLL